MVERAGDRVTVGAEALGDGYPEFAREGYSVIVHGAAAGPFEVAGNEFKLDFDVS